MVALAAWFGCVNGANGQTPPVASGNAPLQEPTFQASVTNVEVSPEVLENGQPVRNLVQSDFLLYDENQPQPISYFAHESAPLDLVLLLDVSGSVRKYLREVAVIAGTALAQLQPNDQSSVMLFSRNTWVEQPFTNDHATISEAIRKAGSEEPPGSGTRIYAAAQNAARFLQDQPQNGIRRRAILMITDNDAMSYDVHQDQALRALLDNSITFDAIVVGPHPHPPAPRNGSGSINPNFAFDDVFPLAQQTGGEAVATNKPKDNLAEMLGRLRERYLLVYAAPSGLPLHSFRRIRVELSPTARRNHPRATVRARDGYYVNGPA